MKHNKYMFSHFAACYIDAAHVLLKVVFSFVCVSSIGMWILKYCALKTQGHRTQHISLTQVVL